MTTRPLAATVGFTVLAAIAAGVTTGRTGVLGAFLGGAVICFTFSVTFWLMGWTRRFAPEAVMAVALAAYAGKILLLGLLLILLWDAMWLDSTVFAITAIGATTVWLGMVIWQATRNRTPVYDGSR